MSKQEALTNLENALTLLNKVCVVVKAENEGDKQWDVCTDDDLSNKTGRLIRTVLQIEKIVFHRK